MLELPPLSLYVHFPWCLKKCPYCDFNSHSITDTAIPQQDYLQALKKDLSAESIFAQGRPLQSIFFGGGTPSLMAPQTVENIIEQAEAEIGFAEGIEITLEANPGTAEQQRFRDYKHAGVNRFSLGIQSFDNKQLNTLGRIHSSEESVRAVEMLHGMGVNNFNLDLMFALPEQTREQAMLDLETAIALEPAHISWYQLTIEQNTPFFRQPPILPDEDQQFEILNTGHQLLADSGYRQYETSAFALEGKQCSHNINYWAFGDYLGIGAGAHGKISEQVGESLEVRRRQKTRVPEHYLNSLNPCCSDERVISEDLPLEFAMNALRLTAGVSRQLFQQRTGLSWSELEPWAEEQAARGMLAQDNSRLCATKKGGLLLNSVLLEL